MNPEEIPNWVPFLRRTLLFRDLTPEDLNKVAEKLKALSLPKGATLYSRGDLGDSFYLITSGQVRLLAERSGREVVTAFLGRGDALGELSLLTGEPRSVTVRLDTTAEFLMLSKKDFEDVVRENPTIMIQLSRIIAQRMLHSEKTKDPINLPKQQITAFLAAIEEPVKALMMMHVAINLVEQTRRRVLLVDMAPESGLLAKAIGVKPLMTNESMLREQDLRNPEVLRNLVTEHPCGLQIMNLPASVLGGRLYRGIFLLMNLLRDSHDFVLISFGDQLGDVEKSILEEADRWVLIGSQSRQERYRELEAALEQNGAESRRLMKVWTGPMASVSHPFQSLIRVPWPDDMTAQYARGFSPYQVMDAFPKTARALRSLTRRIGRLSVGLAMGSGAALGYSLIGVLKGLKAANIDVDFISGTSMGALVAGLYAAGLEPDEIENIAVRVDKAWIYENLFWDLTIPRNGIFAGITMLRFFKSYFGEREFHELEIPFSCVATDIETGEAVVLKEGRVAEAVRASCGIPLLFAPFHHQGRYLVDGGLVEPVPTRVLSPMGADVLISVHLTMPAKQRKTAVRERSQSRHLPLSLAQALKAPHMLETLFQMIYTMEFEIAQSRLDLVHVLIQPELGEFSWTELHRAKEIIEQGEKAVDDALSKIKTFLPYFNDYCTIPIRTPWKSY